MPEHRRIGTWASGKRHLGAAIEALKQHEFRAAQIWLTPAAKREIIEVEDFAALRFNSRHEVLVYVHAPYTDSLFPPLVKHGKQMDWLRKLGAEVEKIEATLILHHGRHKDEYLDTAVAAAAQMLMAIPASVPVLIENDSQGQIEPLVRLVSQLRNVRPNVSVCLDTAHAWAAGQQYLFEDAHRLMTFVKRCYDHLGLLHLNNTTAPFGSQAMSDHFPIFSGEIAVEQFAAILRAFPQVPVVLERSNFLQAVVDRSAVIAIDCNLTQTLEALRNSPINGSLPS